MRLRHHTALIVLLLPAGCTTVGSLLPGAAPDPADLAAEVTIARDEWGVPHIFGAGDAAVLFGLGYAQAEDDFRQLEEDYLHALGRASHWYGERYLAADLVRAAFEVERLAREEYEREPEERRVLWDAFAAGINYYIGTSGVRPRLLTHFEPWMPFALARAIPTGAVVDGVLLGRLGGDSAFGTPVGAWVGAEVAPDGEEADTDGTTAGDIATATGWNSAGSTLLAVASSRTADGQPLLLHQDAGSWSGSGRRYEMMLESESGWHVRGHARLGLPVPAAGHNAQFAWAHIGSDADVADVFEVTFDHPSDPLMYRHDGGWQTAVEWEDTLLVNSPAGVTQRVFRFRRTVHGPVVAVHEGRALALRFARMEEGGSLQQMYDESRAAGLDQFRAALDQRAVVGNTMYADAEGNIYFLHGGAVPVRNNALDWTAPVDGSTAETAWTGYHSIADLPEILNPAGGWLQSTGAGYASVAAPGDAPDPARFPRYMSTRPEGARAASARRVAGADSAWTLDALAAASFDTWIPGVDDAIPPLIAEWEQVGGQNAQRARALDAPVDLLRSWDHVAAAESEAATLYVLWQERLHTGDYTGEYARFRAMEDVVARLQRDHGSAAVAWGVVNRLQRTSGIEAGSGDEPASLPLGGAPAWAGTLFVVGARDDAGGRRPVAGTRWISVTRPGPDMLFRSVVPFGQSGDSASAHWFDQAPLFARGELKAARFNRDDVLAAARRVYRPDEADAAVR